VITVLVLYAGCIGLFVLAWRTSMRGAFIAAPVIVFGLSEIRAGWPATIAEVAQNPYNLKPAIVMSMSFLTFMTCFILFFKCLGGSSARPAQFREAPVESPYSDRAHRFSILAQVAVLVAAGTVLYQGAPPILDALRTFFSPDQQTDAFVELSRQRQSVTKGHVFEGDQWRGQGLISVLMRVGWTYAVVSAIVMYRRTRQRTWLLTCVVLGLLAMSYVGGVGERSPMVTVLLSIFFAISLMSRVRFRHVSVAFAIIAVFTVIIAPLSGRYTNVGSTTESALKTAQRAFFGNGTNNIWIVYFVDNGAIDLGWGQLHQDKLASALPGVKDDSNFANQLIRLRPDSTSQVGNASPTYFGLLFADFGPIGTIVAYGAMGAVTALVQVGLFRRRKRAADVALVTGITTAFIYLSVGTSVAVVVIGIILAGVYGCDRLFLTLHGRRRDLGHRLVGRIPPSPLAGERVAPERVPAGRA